jgi:hypothetical protein
MVQSSSLCVSHFRQSPPATVASRQLSMPSLPRPKVPILSARLRREKAAWAKRNPLNFDNKRNRSGQSAARKGRRRRLRFPKEKSSLPKICAEWRIAYIQPDPFARNAYARSRLRGIGKEKNDVRCRMQSREANGKRKSVCCRTTFKRALEKNGSSALKLPRKTQHKQTHPHG